jgi:hypothetical protein
MATRPEPVSQPANCLPYIWLVFFIILSLHKKNATPQTTQMVEEFIFCKISPHTTQCSMQEMNSPAAMQEKETKED